MARAHARQSGIMVRSWANLATRGEDAVQWISARACGGLIVLLLAVGALAPASLSAPAPPAAAQSAGSITVAGSGASADSPASQGLVRLRLSGQRLATEAPIWLADDRGYFRQEGIEIEHITFGSASEMIPALATGQLDVAPMPANPAMWNAVARGVGAKIVVDLGTYRPGESEQALMVRRAVYDSGRGQQLADLRNLSLAITPPGKATTTACALSVGLQQAGLTLDDVNIQPITFPDMVGAMANGSVDAAMMVEPFVTRALQQGTAVRVMGLGDIYPNFTIATLGFADPLYNNRPVAKGFVRAYLGAVREFLAAVSGPVGSPARVEVSEVIARGTGLDPATVAAMVPPYFNPNGLPNRDSMLYCYQFFVGQGLITQPIPEATLQSGVWGTDLVEEVLGEIGRVP
jgi:NitT/TauT family transport system substrate-binding protein